MAQLPTVMVTGTLYNEDLETLYTGPITFRRSVLLTHVDGTAALPGSITYNVVNGAVSVELLFVDDPEWSPADWAWEVLVPRGSVMRLYLLAPSIDDPDAVTLGDLLSTEYVPTVGEQYAAINHTHSGLATDAELTEVEQDLADLEGLVGTKLNASQVGGLITAALATASERLTTSPVGEYTQRRKDVNTVGPITTGVMYVSHFTALVSRKVMTLHTTTQSVVGVGGTHGWIGLLSWDGTQYLPLAVSEDQPSRWSSTFTDYNTPIFAAAPGTGLANLASAGYDVVAGQRYAEWRIWTGSGTAPSLPACFHNTLDALNEPRDAGFMALTAPPSGAIQAAWLSQLGRCYQTLMRP